MRPQRLSDLSKQDMPRERFKNRGAGVLDKQELLAVVLGRGTKGADVLELAREIIKKFDTDLLDDDTKSIIAKLAEIKGVGEDTAIKILGGIQLGKRLKEDVDDKHGPVRSTEDIVRRCDDLKQQKVESLCCFYLDARSVIKKQSEITRGTLDRSLFHPREIFAQAVLVPAASIVLVHNHPSGNPSPSNADRAVMKRVVQAGQIMGIKVLDFVIVAKHDFYSCLAEAGQNNAGELDDVNYNYLSETSEPTRYLSDIIDVSNQAHRGV